MEVFEAVRTVLAVRSYQDKPVPPDVVLRIVEAGRLTGSSMNGQPWYFIVVENPDTLRQLGALAQTGPYIAQAPLEAQRLGLSGGIFLAAPFTEQCPESAWIDDAKWHVTGQTQ